MIPTIRVNSGVRELMTPLRLLSILLAEYEKSILGIPLPSIEDTNIQKRIDLSYFLIIGIRKGSARKPPKNMRSVDSSKVVKLRVPIFISINELPQIEPRRNSVSHWRGLTLVFSTGFGD
jgi:hypothetical protein